MYDLPLWTRNLRPTKFGKMVHALELVRIGVFVLSASVRLGKAVKNGPFQDDLDLQTSEDHILMPAAM